jgi:hypothetical protein
MSGICSCDGGTYVNLNRPNCVIEMKAIAFPIIFPRYDKDGNRNFIDLATVTDVGQHIKDMIANYTTGDKRWVPFPRCENASFDRSETVYETAPSTRKYKIEGVGGVRTMKYELWGKDGVHAILRELEKIGCSEMDFVLVDVAGNIWGIKEDPTSTILTGYEMATETFDAFKVYATDTTTQKIMVQFDLDNETSESNSFAITPSELGYKGTTLKGLVSTNLEALSATATTIIAYVSNGFGSALNALPITGLVVGDFLVKVNGGAGAFPTSIVETTAGRYTLTVPTMASGANIEVLYLGGSLFAGSSDKFTV